LESKFLAKIRVDEMTEVLDLSKKNSKRLCKTHADYYLDLRDLNKEFKEDFESLELKKRKIDSVFRKRIYESNC
jgi:hypothetical protein